jgi:capsular polysaccharide biosynthesis protein
MARYVEVLFRYWLRFAIVLIIAPLALGGASVAVFRTYQATASLWVQSPDTFGQSVTPSGWNSYLTPAQNQADTLQQLITTLAFDDQIGDRLVAKGVVANVDQRNAIVASIPIGMKVTPDGSHLVTITFSNASQTAGVGVIQAAVDLFLERQIALQRQQEDLSTTFLTGQLKTAQAQLATSEAALQQYLADHPGVRLATTGQDTGILALDQLVHQVQQNRDKTTQLQTELDQALFLGGAAQQLVETNTKLVDQPHITHAGITGDGSSLKRAVIALLVCLSAGIAYVVVLVWADKTARDTKEVQRRLRVPVLATIPLMGSEDIA